MKQKLVIVAAALAAAFAPAIGAQEAQEEPALTAAERGGILVGYAELCQEFGGVLLEDHRIEGLKTKLGSFEFDIQREKIKSEFRGGKRFDMDENCPKIDEFLDDWAGIYGIPLKDGGQ